MKRARIYKIAQIAVRGLPLLYLLFVCFPCCNSPKNKHNRNLLDSLKNGEGFLEGDTSSIFSNTISAWLDSNLKINEADKKLILEEHWKDDSVQTEAFIADKSFLIRYESVLRWSADSIHILDIGSYGKVPVEDEKGAYHLEAGEPDTELALLNTKRNERTRLMFAGPSSNIINGRWLNSSELLVLGTFLTEPGRPDTLVWIIDINEKLFRLYNLKTKRKEAIKSVRKT